MKRRKREVGDMSKEEYRQFRKDIAAYLDEKYGDMAICSLSRPWIGFPAGLRCAVYFEEICKVAVRVAKFENGYHSTFGSQLDDCISEAIQTSEEEILQFVESSGEFHSCKRNVA